MKKMKHSEDTGLTKGFSKADSPQARACLEACTRQLAEFRYFAGSRRLPKQLCFTAASDRVEKEEFGTYCK